MIITSTMSEADADGSLTAKYYKTDLKPEAFATSQNISWTAVGEDQKRCRRRGCGSTAE